MDIRPDTSDDLPHSPDVAERETLDNGFSRGWGFHFQPSEEYWLDCHCHMGTETTYQRIYRLMEQWFAELDAFRLGKVAAIVKAPEALAVYRDIAAQDKRFGWIYWMPYDKPDAELMQRALDHSAMGLKLHNSPLMSGNSDPRVWLDQAWQKVFETLEHKKSSVIWHVTQRVSVSPYHGGGANSYWSAGSAKGNHTSNEELLQIFLEVVRRYPQIAFIGAHQLHIGLARLEKLLAEYPNLYIDTSCGFLVRWSDTLYENDRAILRRFFLRHADRILFGTDAQLAADITDPYRVQAFLCHTRFINQLRLPNEVLQKVAHENAERIFRWAPVKPARRGNSRP